MSLADGRIAGLEAFIRWQHPTVGRIPPTEFIGVAEVSPLIHDLGDWVADQVCQQVRRWATHVPPSRIPPVDINYSQTQLLHASFVQRLVAILRRNELPGEAIRIDVNESDLMEAAATVLGLLERLQHHGVQAVIDDFGTGFSSLQMLHALPVGALKIDGAFLPGEASGVESWVIARSIVELGRVLGLDVIAEGVETGEQIRTLRQIGCRLGQGFAFSGPVGAGRALELIRDGYPLDVGSTAG